MEEDDKTVMNPELGLKMESSVQIKGTEFGSNYPNRSESVGSDRMDKGYVHRVRPSDANWFAVGKRSKRLKSASGVGIWCSGDVRGNPGICRKGEEAVVSNGEVGEYGGDDTVYAGGNGGNLGDYGYADGELVEVEVNQEPMAGENEDNSGDSGYADGELVEVEVKEEPIIEAAAVARSNGTRRFPGGLQDAVSLEVEGLESKKSNVMASPKARKMEISKKITIKGRPKTVKELFETGLLEGYPVFYNGGSRVSPLRGSIKGTGILCLCSSCKGVRVFSPCHFEIHACKSYRRASQYICLENGKSLLDVVKECRKSSVNTLEQAIQKFVGPIPVKESAICMNCHASKVKLVCDSCMNVENSEVDAECTKSRHSELASNTKSPQRSPLQISTRRGQQKIMKIRRQPVSKFSGSASARHSKSSSDLHANGGDSSRGSMRNNNMRKILKKYQKMHWMVFEDGGLPDGTEVAYYSNGKKLRVGYKMGSGIMCRCCSTLVSPSQFEAHAGCASRRKPYMYIYTSNGVSLHEFAVSLLKGRKISAKDNDDLCIIHAVGGKLVFCDGCPRAFRKECDTSFSIPHDKIYCTYCQNKFQKERIVEAEHNSNAVMAGRVLGVDPIEQITNQKPRRS